jgi:hypothetical protein
MRRPGRLRSVQQFALGIIGLGLVPASGGPLPITSSGWGTCWTLWNTRTGAGA